MKMFQQDSPLMRGLAFAFDLIAVNMLFLLCCLPVVTIGASCTALHAMARRLLAGNDIKLAANFRRLFAANLRQATLAWLPLLAVGALLWINAALPGESGILVRIAMLCVGAPWFLILLYIFPLIGRYESGALESFKNALLVAVSQLPRTLLLALTVLLPLAFALYAPAELFVALLPLLLLAGFAGIACVQEKILAGVYRAYDERQNPAGED